MRTRLLILGALMGSLVDVRFPEQGPQFHLIGWHSVGTLPGTAVGLIFGMAAAALMTDPILCTLFGTGLLFYGLAVCVGTESALLFMIQSPALLVALFLIVVKVLGQINRVLISRALNWH